MHYGHLVHVNAHDRAFATGDLLSGAGLALTDQAWRERLAQIEEAGATEIAFQPAGPDIPDELEALARAARG
jgi:5,10-methylenetetrahydromethanopterin reductase